MLGHYAPHFQAAPKRQTRPLGKPARDSVVKNTSKHRRIPKRESHRVCENVVAQRKAKKQSIFSLRFGPHRGAAAFGGLHRSNGKRARAGPTLNGPPRGRFEAALRLPRGRLEAATLPPRGRARTHTRSRETAQEPHRSFLSTPRGVRFHIW